MPGSQIALLQAQQNDPSLYPHLILLLLFVLFILILILILVLLLLVAASASAQKAERDYIRKGNRFFKDSVYVDAEVNYRKALEVNPKSTVSMFNLGNIISIDFKGRFLQFVQFSSCHHLTDFLFTCCWSDNDITFLYIEVC